MPAIYLAKDAKIMKDKQFESFFEKLAEKQFNKVYGFTQLLALLHRVQEGSMYRHYGIHLSQSFRRTKIVLFTEKNKFSSRFLPARLQNNRFCKGQVPNVADKTKLILHSGTKILSKLSYNKFNSGVYPPLCIILYLPPYIKGEGG